MTYLWIKALHIIFMTSWFAGLFYLPRIFVNLAMVSSQEGSDETYCHLLTMAKKLYRFVTPFMYLTIILGTWMLVINNSLYLAVWMQVKLALVSTLIIYHVICGRVLKTFENKESAKTHVFYRFFNEYPVIVLFAVVILVILKP